MRGSGDGRRGGLNTWGTEDSFKIVKLLSMILVWLDTWHIEWKNGCRIWQKNLTLLQIYETILLKGVEGNIVH